jgi:predicted transcriptional regulator
MSIRRKSLAAVFSFSDKQKGLDSNHTSVDGAIVSVPQKEKPEFGSVTLKAVIRSADKPSLISVSPSTSIGQALEIMQNNKIFSLPLMSRSKPGILML